MIRKTLFFIVFFLFFFSIEFVFYPIRMRWVLTLVGTYCIMKDVRHNVFYFNQKRKWKNLLILLISLVFIALISSIVNGNFDPYFYKVPLRIYISLSSAYAFFYIIRKFFHITLSIDDYILLMLHACFIQIGISLIGFLNSGFLNFATGIMVADDIFLETTASYEGNMGRIIGIGASFFGAGCIYAMVATLAALVIKKETNLFKQILYILEVLIILIIGAAIARTALLGIFGFLFVLLWRDVNSNTKRIFSGVVVLLLIGWGFINVFMSKLENSSLFGEALNRAFSMYYAYKDYGEFQSMQSMAGESIWPNSLKTWLIGDGLMADPQHPTLAYYMNQDRGWNRLIFGIGIIGGIFYSGIQYMLCRLTGLRKIYVWVLFLYFCAFMVKGITSHDVILAPLIVLSVSNNIQQRKLANRDV